MARVTVEDCVDKVPNRFDLVMLAAHRARSIADETLIAEDLREQAIESYQRHIEIDEPQEDNMALLMGGAESAPPDVIDELDEEKLLRALLAEQDRK